MNLPYTQTQTNLFLFVILPLMSITRVPWQPARSYTLPARSVVVWIACSVVLVLRAACAAVALLTFDLFGIEISVLDLHRTSKYGLPISLFHALYLQGGSYFQS